MVASAVRIVCASSAAGSRRAEASGSGCAARLGVAAPATASSRARPGGARWTESCLNSEWPASGPDRTARPDQSRSPRRRHRRSGSNGAATTCGDSRRGAGSTVAGAAACRRLVLRGVLGGGDRDGRRRWRSTDRRLRRVSEPSAIRVAPRTVELTPRIWSTMSPAPLVAIAAEPGVADPVHGVEVGLGIRKSARRTSGGPVRAAGSARLAAAAWPGRRGGSACPAVAGAVGGVGHDVAGGHRVDGDQQVRVDGQAQRAAEAPSGSTDGWWRTPRRPAGCPAGRRWPAMSPARRPSAARVSCRPAAPAASRGRSAKRPQHGDRHGLGGVGCDHGGHGAYAWPEVIEWIGRDAQHGQQEAAVVEPGRFAVVGCAVDVDKQRVDAGLVDVERLFGQRNAAGRTK